MISGSHFEPPPLSHGVFEFGAIFHKFKFADDFAICATFSRFHASLMTIAVKLPQTLNDKEGIRDEMVEK
jgi:hypothetical protein